MLRKVSAIVLIVAILFVVGCSTHIHKVGNGPQGNDMTEVRQWYLIAGLVPINEVNTNAMAGGSNNYEIVTTENVIDVIVTIVTGALVTSRTVTVRK